MKPPLAFVALVLIALPTAAFDRGEATRIMVVPDAGTSQPPALRQLCRSLADSLRDAGKDVFVYEGDPATADRSTVAHIVVVSSAEDTAVHEGLLGVGSVGHSGVGADIDLVRSRAAARIHLLDPATLEVVDTFDLEETAVRPALSSINIGDRHGYLRIPVWFGRRSREQAATRSLGERIATRVLTPAEE